MPAIALVAAGARLGLSLGKIFGGHGFDVALIARSTQRLGELTGCEPGIIRPDKRFDGASGHVPGVGIQYR